MRVCRNCRRAFVGGYWAGAFCFCSPMCRDTSAELRSHEQAKKAQRTVKRSPCFEGCLVCDGKGGANG